MIMGSTSFASRRRLSRRGAIASGLVAGAAFRLRAAPQAMARTGTPVAKDESGFLPGEDLRLTRIVAEQLGKGAIPGALIGIWYPGRGAWVQAMGIGDLATAVPITTDDHVRIASITKTFTGTVVLQLVDEGKLSLDDTLATFVSDIASGDQITIRELLNMTAGVFDYVNDPDFGPAYDADPLHPLSQEDFLAIVRQHPADFAPGSEVHYSNSNTFLLGLIIEQVTGQSAGEAITQRIIEPLGLTETSFPTTPQMPAPYAHGYQAPAPGDPLIDVTNSNPDVPWTAGAIISTLGDLRTWSRALGTGSLLSSEMQQERLAGNPLPGAAAGIDARYGLGLLTINGLIGHSGGIAGYSLWMLYAPEEDATLVIIVTRTNAAEPILESLLPVVFPDRFQSSQPLRSRPLE